MHGSRQMPEFHFTVEVQRHFKLPELFVRKEKLTRRNPIVVNASLARAKRDLENSLPLEPVDGGTCLFLLREPEKAV